MSESLIFLSESLIRSFLGKKRAIRSENQCGIYKTIDPYPDPSAALGDGNLIYCSKKICTEKYIFQSVKLYLSLYMNGKI